MPACVQDLLVEVQSVQRHSLPEPTWSCSVLCPHLVPRYRATDLLRLERRLVRLQNDVIHRVGIVYPEVIVV